MADRRGQTAQPHTLTLTVRPCGQGDGFDVDAACGCSWRWAWIGWATTPIRAADEGATEWSGHLAGAGRNGARP